MDKMIYVVFIIIVIAARIVIGVLDLGGQSKSTDVSFTEKKVQEFYPMESLEYSSRIKGPVALKDYKSNQ